MKKGLEILESRNLADEISFTSLELSLGIKVPPLLKIFHESFVIPKDIGTKYYQNARVAYRQTPSGMLNLRCALLNR